METYKINYKSDFDFPIKALGKGDVVLDLGKYDWVLTLSTPNGKNTFEAAHKGGAWAHCCAVDGGAVVVCDNPGLDIGKVSMELAVEIPDALFPDKYRRIVSKIESGIYLTQATTEVSHISDAFVFSVPVSVDEEKPDVPDKPAEPSEPNMRGVANYPFLSGRLYHKGLMPLAAHEGVFYEVPYYDSTFELKLKCSTSQTQSLIADGAICIFVPKWLRDLGKPISTSTFIFIQNHNPLHDIEYNDFYDSKSGRWSINVNSPDRSGIIGAALCLVFKHFHSKGPFLVGLKNGRLEFHKKTAYDFLPHVAEPTKEELQDIFENNKIVGFRRYCIKILRKSRGRRGEKVEGTGILVTRKPRWNKYGSPKNRVWSLRPCSIVKVYRKTKAGTSAASVWSIPPKGKVGEITRVS